MHPVNFPLCCPIYKTKGPNNVLAHPALYILGLPSLLPRPPAFPMVLQSFLGTRVHHTPQTPLNILGSLSVFALGEWVPLGRLGGVCVFQDQPGGQRLEVWACSACGHIIMTVSSHLYSPGSGINM